MKLIMEPRLTPPNLPSSGEQKTVARPTLPPDNGGWGVKERLMRNQTC